MLTVLAGLALATTLFQLVLVLLVRRGVPRLDSLSAPLRERWPLVSMIVPARDEAANLEAALKSKLDCGYPSLDIVAIDDRSTDATPDILAKLANEDPRLQRVRVDTLPDGWLGKLNAMNRGLEAARGEWVLFADADVHLKPGTLQRLIAHAEAHGVDFFGVFPQMQPSTPAVEAALAVTLRVLAISGRIWKANDDHSKLGFGVGAFNLARRSWLEKTKALDALKMEVIDDVGLGAFLKHHGARTRFLAGRGAVHLLFMDSLRSVMKSSSKAGHMFGWGLGRPFALGVLPTAVELVLPGLALASGDPLTRGFGAASVVLSFAMHALICAHFLAPMRGAWLWPLGVVINGVCTWIAGFSAWKHQGIWWRGNFYSRAQLDAGQVIEMPSLGVRRRE